MADRAYVWCPLCDKQGMQTELLRGNPELHIFSCDMGHRFTYQQLQSLGARMIPLQAVEKPGATDLKIEFWLPPDLINNYRQKYPNQQNSTLASILAVLLDDDYVIVSGAQARQLKAMNIKNGAEMVACAENNKTLVDQNEQLVKEVDRFYSAIAAKQQVEA